MVFMIFLMVLSTSEKYKLFPEVKDDVIAFFSQSERSERGVYYTKKALTNESGPDEVLKNRLIVKVRRYKCSIVQS